MLITVLVIRHKLFSFCVGRMHAIHGINLKKM
jgi:hypothetical protein